MIPSAIQMWLNYNKLLEETFVRFKVWSFDKAIVISMSIGD